MNAIAVFETMLQVPLGMKTRETVEENSWEISSLNGQVA